MKKANARKIDVIIAGAQKAGTSSLKRALEQHPDVFSHAPLECDFFSGENEDWDGYFQQNVSSDGKIFLGKLAHLAQYEKYVRKFYHHNPDAHIVFVLRDPIARIRSAYEMETKVWADFSPRRFLDAIEANRIGEYDVVFNSFIRLGNYGELIEIFLKYFPVDVVQFVDCDDFKRSPGGVCLEIFIRLGLEPFDAQPVHENIGHGVKSKRLSRFLNGAARSRVRLILERFFGRAFLMSIKAAISKLNASESVKGDSALWDPEILEALSDYYRETDERFIYLTGHVPSWRR